MKNSPALNIILLLAFILISSCSENFLNTDPATEFPEEDVWKDAPLAQAFINDLYNQIPWNFNLTCQLVDESRARSDINDFNLCNMVITPDDPTCGALTGNGNYGNWGGTYKSIRACNIFLENIDKFPDSTTVVDGKRLKDRMKGEVIFLRAWYYHMLVLYYGGVPLITKAYVLTDDFTIARNTYAECVQFISDECDRAAALLPEVNSGANNGRATKGASLALKSRILLHAASDLHNTSRFSGYAHPELLGYTDGNQTARWQAAKDAAKAVMDMGVYNLYKPEPASAEEATLNYQNLFLSTPCEEDIFYRFFSASANKGVGGFELAPNGWVSNARVGAVNELVDAYEMNDGTLFSRTNPQQEAEPYKNRDPRFYATILYEGAKLTHRISALEGFDPIGVMQTGTWEKWDAESNTIVYINGLDSRNSVMASWNSNNCGATCKKYLDPSVEIFWGQYNQDLIWHYIRFGEVLLNYAEACIELHEDGEAVTALNMIRKRAFMPDITESGDALKLRYRNERRIEMAYENQRFFDVRRWMIGPEAYHAVHGVTVVYKLNPDHTTATIPTITPVEIMTGSWDDKAYFMPISRDELNKNNKLFQNPGY
jgi:starch-binding outer membrane protein, SusD/RagB family